MVYAPTLHAISFRLATLDTSLPEGGNRDVVAPSPTNLIYTLLAGGASPSPTETDFATQNQLHLCKAQTSLQSNFTWRSQTSPRRKAPPPTGTLCRIRHMAVYHQGNALYIITPWCVSFHNIRVANTSLVQNTNFTADQLHLAKPNFTI